MEQKVNIAKILENAPKGTKLWSPVCGDCELVCANKEGNYPIVVRTNECKYESEYPKFSIEGKFTKFKNGECLLFPSKNNRDWSTFKRFSPFQKVLVRGTTNGYYWWAALYSHYDAKNKLHMIVGGGAYADEYILPYEGNEEMLGKPINKNEEV